ncbi:MAG: type II toxin-antitoxin system RelE/ParE family toxin [Planctomycetota bacterium]
MRNGGVMARYELTVSAAQDFQYIFEFGIDRFGLTQALEYQNGLKTRFSELAEQPLLYEAVDDIREGYRRSVFKSHAIYYMPKVDHVLIVRILGQQDIESALR